MPPPAFLFLPRNVLVARAVAPAGPATHRTIQTKAETFRNAAEARALRRNSATSCGRITYASAVE